MAKTWRAEKLERKPKRVEKKLPRKVRIEDFVQTMEEHLEDDFPEYEEDECSRYRSIRD